MTTTSLTFHCLTCKRNLGHPEQLPEECPRCGTPLASLQKILQEAISSYRCGCLALRCKKYAEALQAFEKAAKLWRIDCFQEAQRFAGLLLKMRAKSETPSEKIIRKL